VEQDEPNQGENKSLIVELLWFFTEFSVELFARLKRLGSKLFIAWALLSLFFIAGILLGPPFLKAVSTVLLGLSIALPMVLPGLVITAAARRFPAFRDALHGLANFVFPFLLLSLKFIFFPARDTNLILLQLVATFIFALTFTFFAERTNPRVFARIACLIAIVGVSIAYLAAFLPETFGVGPYLFRRFDYSIFRGLSRLSSPKLISVNSLKEFENLHRFGPNGEPLVWYAQRSDGTYDLFDSPGYHPLTRQELRPITPEIVGTIGHYFISRQKEEDLKRESAERRLKEGAEAEHLRQQKREEEELANRHIEEEQLRKKNLAEQTERRRKELASLYSVPPGNFGRMVAIEVRFSQNVRVRLGNPAMVIAQEMERNRAGVKLVPSLFNESFRTRGYFSQVFNGSGDLLNEMGVFTYVSYVILGEIDGDCVSNPVRNDMFTCHLTLMFKVFDSTGRVVDSGQLRTSSAGFTREEALNRGVEQFGERDGDRILAVLKSARS
jgi:hypothetical protein